MQFYPWQFFLLQTEQPSFERVLAWIQIVFLCTQTSYCIHFLYDEQYTIEKDEHVDCKLKRLKKTEQTIVMGIVVVVVVYQINIPLKQVDKKIWDMWYLDFYALQGVLFLYYTVYRPLTFFL